MPATQVYSGQLEPKEDMALRKEDKDWVTEEIATAIREHLNPHGWRRLGLFLKTWIPLGAAISIFIALLALAGAGWNFAFTRVDKEARFQTQTTYALGQIKATVTGLQSSVTLLQAQVASSKYSAVPIKDLKKHREELNTIKNSLVQTPQNTPGYWPASFEIIALLSQAQFQLETIGQRPLSVMSDIRMVNVPALAFVVREKNVLLKNLIQGVHFENSVIHFDPSVKLVDDTFLNCVFILPPQENPPKSFQQIGRTLLTSDLSKVTLNVS